MKTIDKIIEIVTSYKELPSDYLDIDDLLHRRKLLSGELVLFGTNVGDAKLDWKKAVSQYEAKKNQMRVEYKDQGTTKADWIARSNCEEELEAIGVYESLYYKYDYVFKAVKEVLSEMNQRISYLKSEKKQSIYHGE